VLEHRACQSDGVLQALISSVAPIESAQLQLLLRPRNDNIISGAAACWRYGSRRLGARGPLRAT